MGTRHVVVDGSNIATEGRSMPSLAQLDEGVRAYMAENPDDEIIVVVDASFGYRIDESERALFEEAEDAGEVVSPPAGAIGRGDGFLLRIADRVDATVLSNDSFQEFHGEYTWLFDDGRLVGGKPVPGVGWIFTPRTPVRGPRSRMATRDAQKGVAGVGRGRGRSRKVSEPVVEAIAEATAEVISPPAAQAPDAAGAPEGARSGRSGRRRPRGKPGPGPGTVNEPLPFITFIAEHHLGTEVEGVVEEFTSHGAFVTASGARCYVPLVGLAKPPPRSAKEVLDRGETRTFVVQALDAPRRGIELALPGLARISGVPTEETVEAEIGAGGLAGAPSVQGVEEEAVAPASAPPRKRTRRATKAPALAAEAAPEAPPKKARPVGTRTPAQKALAKEALAKKAAAKAAPAPELAAGEGAPVSELPAATEAPAKKAAAKKAAARRSPTEGAPTEGAPTERAPARKKAPAKQAPAGVANVPPAKRAPAKRAPAKRAPAKAAAVKKAAAAKRAPAKQTAPAKAATATKAPGKKTAAKTTAAKKTAAKTTAAKKTAAKKALANKTPAKKSGAGP